MLDTHTVDTFIDFYLSLKVRGRLVIIGYISKYGTDTSSQVMPFLASLPQKVGITIDIDTFNTLYIFYSSKSKCLQLSKVYCLSLKMYHDYQFL